MCINVRVSIDCSVCAFVNICIHEKVPIKICNCVWFVLTRTKNNWPNQLCLFRILLSPNCTYWSVKKHTNSLRFLSLIFFLVMHTQHSKTYSLTVLDLQPKSYHLQRGSKLKIFHHSPLTEPRCLLRSIYTSVRVSRRISWFFWLIAGEVPLGQSFQQRAVFKSEIRVISGVKSFDMRLRKFFFIPQFVPLICDR